MIRGKMMSFFISWGAPQPIYKYILAPNLLKVKEFLKEFKKTFFRYHSTKKC